jgi:ADP-ribosylglycohydrolase
VTIGYFNGNWEFNYDNPNAPAEYVNDMISEYISFGGINDMSIANWRASDDTLMYFETFKILIFFFNDKNDDGLHGIELLDAFMNLFDGKKPNISSYGKEMQKGYLDLLPKMENRHMGNTTHRSLEIQKHIEWNKLQYNKDDKGSGTSMRTGCIGIIFPGKHNRKRLIIATVEACRITHNSAVAILGGITAALFTAYAIEKMPIGHWPHELLKVLRSDLIDSYMEISRPDEYKYYVRDKDLFIDQWEKYIQLRFSGTTPRLDIKHLKNPVLRYQYFASNFSKGHENFAGGAADDSVIMAYDALLESGPSVEKLLIYSILHPGDSDTVGSIAFSWFGAYYQNSKTNDILNEKLLDLEFYNAINSNIYRGIRTFIKIYYYDMYLHIAQSYIDQLELSHKEK